MKIILSENKSIKKKVFTMKSKLLLTFALIIIALTGCDYFENGDTVDISTVEVNLNGLPALPDSMTYVGWFNREKNGVNYYVKVFVQNANATGSISYKSEEPFKNLQEAQAFMLTTEKVSVAQDSLLKPSSRIMLMGRYSEAAAVLNISGSVIDFADSKAVFTLATPTDGPLTYETSGVWFADSVATTPVAGLNLPTLYGGWIYEGWVQVNGQYISTGRFTDPTKADLFNGYSGILAGYNFPGEDFLQDTTSTTSLTFPLNLANAKVNVSIEYKDGRTHGTSPFLKVYEATISGSPQSGVAYPLQTANPILPNGNTFMVVDLVK